MKPDKLSDADANLLLGSDADQRSVMRRTLHRDSDSCCWVMDYDASTPSYEQLIAWTPCRVRVTIKHFYGSGSVQLVDVR